MEKVSRAEFAKHPGQYQEKAMFGQPVIITNGREKTPKTVLLSYELFREFALQNRRALYTADLDDNTINQIINGEMDSRHDELNDLLD